ncbi:MAG: hypothetical protein WC414_03475 [Patescibacteria group bacterium]
MNNRQDKILQFIIENYIKDAEPVGSKFLISNFDLEIGEATARNEMRSLEEQGFLSHPHTSSGRIPTETGYKYYINNLMKPKKISTRDSEDIIKILAEKDEENRLKLLGKILAEKTGLAVIVNIKKDFIYYTGLSNLFSQPEFRDYNLTINVSGIFDRCEHRICDLNNKMKTKEIQCFLGKENPLDATCSLFGLKISDHKIITVLSPLRTDYKKVFSYFNYLKELF